MTTEGNKAEAIVVGHLSEVAGGGLPAGAVGANESLARPGSLTWATTMQTEVGA